MAGKDFQGKENKDLHPGLDLDWKKALAVPKLAVLMSQLSS